MENTPVCTALCFRGPQGSAGGGNPCLAGEDIRAQGSSAAFQKSCSSEWQSQDPEGGRPDLASLMFIMMPVPCTRC